MNIIRNTLKAIIIFCIASPPVYAFIGCGDMFGGFRELKKDLQTSLNELKDDLNHARHLMTPDKAVGIEIKEKEDKVVVQINDLMTNEFDATLSQDNQLLTINIPTGSIALTIDGTYLLVNALQEIGFSDSDEYSSRHSALGKTLQHPINLEEVNIEYNEANITLTISIPMIIEKKSVKKIKVKRK